MYEALIFWVCSLSIEQVFIITGVGILAVGVCMGLLVAWISCRGKKRRKENGDG
jgi:hypothetical protein